jgi:hypothetical protein
VGSPVAVREGIRKARFGFEWERSRGLRGVFEGRQQDRKGRLELGGELKGSVDEVGRMHWLAVHNGKK